MERVDVRNGFARVDIGDAQDRSLAGRNAIRSSDRRINSKGVPVRRVEIGGRTFKAVDAAFDPRLSSSARSTIFDKYASPPRNFRMPGLK